MQYEKLILAYVIVVIAAATVQKQSCDAYFDKVNQLKSIQAIPHRLKLYQKTNFWCSGSFK